MGLEQEWEHEIRYYFLCERLDLSNFALERRIRDHTRSIHKLSYSHVVQHYCLTGSADGDVRIWVSKLNQSNPSLTVHRIYEICRNL